MSRSKIFFVILVLLFILSAAATAGMYKWVDEKGITHFSDRPPRASKSKAKVEMLPAQRVRFQYEENYKSKYNNTEDASDDRSPGPEEVRPRANHSVELYATSWCPYCKKARNFFQSRGIPFKEYDIEKDPRAAERKKQLDTGRGVPFVVIDGQGISGFIPAAYEKALGEG